MASRVRRRRNGLLQACEPCRKRKLACDHSVPCVRCKGRGVEDECSYVVSFPARGGGNGRSEETRVDGPATGRDASRTGPQLQQQQQKKVDSTASTAYTPNGVSSKVLATAFSTTSPDQPAFFGPTSFSAVFLEHQDQLSSAQTGPDGYGGLPARTVAVGLDGAHANEQLGVRTLGQIPSERMCTTLFKRHVNPNSGWIRLAAERLCQSLWPSMGSYLRKGTETSLKAMAQRISINTSSVLPEEDNPVGWLTSFSGSNLRWEALGILFTSWAFGVLDSPEQTPAGGTWKAVNRTSQEWLIEMKRGADACIILSGSLIAPNLLTLYLLQKRAVLESIVSGDSSLVYWRRHADMICVATSLGIHRDTELPAGKISFSSEVRRRVFAAVFDSDKVAATFTGRPPLLSRRYSSMQLPLDIADEDMLSEEPWFTESLASLDPAGWNTRGEIYTTTILRARTLLAYIRDEVLELALGSATQSDVGRIQSLKVHSASTYASFPRVIVLRVEDLQDRDLPGPTLYAKLLTRLDHLQNLFLLERLLTKLCLTDSQDLLDICGEMLAVTLVWWKDRERLAWIHSDFDWLIMMYAAPAAGILCVELLKQSQAVNPGGLALDCKRLHRSQTIQNLSLFVGFLDWVSTPTTTARLCYRVREIVAKVLDRLLEGPEQDPSLPLQQPPQAFDTDPFALAFDFDHAVADITEAEIADLPSLDLLDTFDWATFSNGG